ncbi:MAG: hypothetical protein K5663_08145 [Clostridiales bacterium]|nr:hypothetical protein [Clostridiales bacterium]
MKDYSDIIDLPRPVSKKHPRMGRLERAAQFAPYAALGGYEELIAEYTKAIEKQQDQADTRKKAENVR